MTWCTLDKRRWAQPFFEIDLPPLCFQTIEENRVDGYEIDNFDKKNLDNVLALTFKSDPQTQTEERSNSDKAVQKQKCPHDHFAQTWCIFCNKLSQRSQRRSAYTCV